MAKILLVEDDNNLREIYEARLQAEGYTIVSAMDGEEALVVAKKEKPDLIISDVMMPRVSGFEMLDILRNTDGLKEVKVIMLTALGQAEDKVRADSLGANRYLVKSQVTLEDIVKAAQELLGPVETPVSPPAESVTVTSPPASTPVASTTPAPNTQTTPTPAAPAPAPTITPSIQPSTHTAQGSTPQTVAEPAAPTSISTPVPTPDKPEEQPGTGTPTPTTPPQPPITDPPMPEPSPTPAAPAPQPTVSAPAEPPTLSPPSVQTPVSSTTASVSTSIPGAQSTSDETAAVKAQIENFVSQNNQTAPKPTPDPVVAMANAIKDLVSEAQTPPKPPSQTAEKVVQPLSTNPAPTASSTATPTLQQQPSGGTSMSSTSPAEPVQSGDNVSISGKKIIQPISTEVSSEPNLDELLAKEGITNLDELSDTPGGNPAPIAPPPEQPVSSSSGLPTTPHPPGHVISPNNGIDPNSIAL